MGELSFDVDIREGTGKSVARKLRAAGRVPGVVYGLGKPGIAVTADVTRLEKLVKASHAGWNTLIDLEGDPSVNGRTVMIREVQREPIRGAITHLDFVEIDQAAKIHVAVKITLTGTPEGVTLGGLLEQQLREIEVLCMANAIPDELVQAVDHLELGDSIHVVDLVLPDGVELAVDETLTVATVMIPRGLVSDDEATVEGEEGAEGEGAEGGDEKADEAKSEDK